MIGLIGGDAMVERHCPHSVRRPAHEELSIHRSLRKEILTAQGSGRSNVTTVSSEEDGSITIHFIPPPVPNGVTEPGLGP